MPKLSGLPKKSAVLVENRLVQWPTSIHRFRLPPDYGFGNSGSLRWKDYMWESVIRMIHEHFCGESSITVTTNPNAVGTVSERAGLLGYCAILRRAVMNNNDGYDHQWEYFSAGSIAARIRIAS